MWTFSISGSMSLYNFFPTEASVLFLLAKSFSWNKIDCQENSRRTRNQKESTFIFQPKTETPSRNVKRMPYGLCKLQWDKASTKFALMSFNRWNIKDPQSGWVVPSTRYTLHFQRALSIKLPAYWIMLGREKYGRAPFT